MAIAAKHFDPIVGFDQHMVLLSGTPMLMPHPYLGVVFDPFDYVPLMQATVFINGVARGVAGTSGQVVLLHQPMFGPFVPPLPSHSSSIFMGSETVACDGAPLSYGGLPVLSCQSVGLPPPKRPGRASEWRSSLVLPTSLVLSIPMGNVVTVGGSPTIKTPTIDSLIQSGFKSAVRRGLPRALRKLLRTKGGLGRAMRAVARRANRAGDALTRLLGLGAQARNRIARSLCTVTGHPVDVATGKVFTDKVDFELPGPIPLRWVRVWYSMSTYRGPIGHGWHGSYDAGLYVADDVVLYRTPDGRFVSFPPVAIGAEHFDRGEGLTLLRGPLGYAVRNQDRLLHRFRAVGRANGEQALSSISDESGHVVELHYDKRGRLARLVDSAGRLLEFAHDSEDRIAAVTAPHPEREGERVTLVQYAYDRGNLVRVLDALNAPARYRYRKTLLVEEADRNGLRFYFEYDGADEHARCVRTFGDGGIYDHKLSYDDDHGITTVENSLGHKTQYEHRDGLVVRTVDALGAVTSVEYDDDGKKLAEIDALVRVARFRYDERGNLIESIAKDGAATRLEYDARDLQTSVYDANGGRFEFRYDDQGRVVERTDPLGQVTRFEYAGGELTAICDGAGGVTTLEYDAQRNLSCMLAPDGSTRHWQHDALGRAISTIDANGNVERCGFDLAGRVVRIDEPDGNTRHLGYDGEGNVLRIRDDQRDLYFEYQGLGRLAARTEAGDTLRFEYDTEEQLIGITNAQGHGYRFELSPTGEVVAETGFDGLERTYARDLAGQVTAVTRPSGEVSKYRYDRAGRVVAIAHADGTYERYAYRVDGELIRAENATVSISFERDLLGRVRRERMGQHWVASAYDPCGARVRMQSSLGADQRIERDAMGRAAAVRHVVKDAEDPFEVRYRRDLLGLEVERNLPGGVRSQWCRDALGRAIDQSIGAGTRTLRTRQYQWGKDDRLQAVSDSLKGAVRYGHDAAGRLAWARHTEGLAELRLPDAVGNLFRREDRRDRHYGSAGQLLESIDEQGRSTAFAYDADGNLIEKRRSTGECWRYRWAADGTLREVERPGGDVVQFAYDALGRRVHKRFRGQTTHFVWDGDVPLHEWAEGEADRSSKSDPITWLFDPDGVRPLAKLAAGTRTAIITDDLGTPTLMLDERGAATWSADLGIWGELLGVKGPRYACPFRWPGQYEDEETGLYYNRFRYYDPESGQYASQDPIGLAGGSALYAYVRDPLIWCDPLGLAGCKRSTAGAVRRTQSAGDITVRTERAARRRAMREHGMSTSQANNFERIPQHGRNPNLKGPNGEPSEVIRGLDTNGNPAEVQHHKYGHSFDDDTTFELPHYHGTRGHISYLGK